MVNILLRLENPLEAKKQNIRFYHIPVHNWWPLQFLSIRLCGVYLSVVCLPLPSHFQIIICNLINLDSLSILLRHCL